MVQVALLAAGRLKEAFCDVVVIERDDDAQAIIKKLEGVEAVFNLAGANIATRWDEAYKKVLYESRIESTQKLVQAINQSHVEHFISASAIGIYPSNQACDESYAFGRRFFSTTGKSVGAQKHYNVKNVLPFCVLVWF